MTQRVEGIGDMEKPQGYGQSAISPPMPLLVFEMDLHGRITSVSSSESKILGEKYGVRLVGRTLVEVVHPCQREHVQDLIEQVKRGKEVECVINTNDSTRSLLTNILPQFDEHGGIRKFIGLAQTSNHPLRPLTTAVFGEQRFQQFIDSVFSYIARLNPDGTVLEANRAALETAGITQEDVRGMPFPQTYWFSHSGKMQGQVCTMLERAQRGETYHEIQTARVQGDQIIDVDACMTPLYAEDGHLMEIVVSGVDITERRRTEAERLALQYAIDQGMEGFALHDNQGLFTYVNPAQAAMYGFGVEELLGRSWKVLYTENQIAIIEQQHWATLRANGRWRGDLVGKKKDGELFNVEVSLTLTESPNGKPTGLICTCRDITERKYIENALRDSEARFRTLTDSVPMLIWETDVDGRCTFVNQPWLHFTGRVFEEEQDEGWVQDVHPDDLAHTLEAIRNAVAYQEAFHLEYRIKRHDGVYRWFLSSGVPRYTPDRIFSGFIGSCVDITEQRQAKTQLEDTYQRLRELTAGLEAAKEAERTRIAQELHDEFGQMLSALHVDLAWIQRRVSALPKTQRAPKLTEKMQAMSSSIHQSIHAVQRIATSLRPPLLDHLGFFPALEWQIRDFQNRTGVVCTLSGGTEISDIETSSDVATALFRITQELLTNITRHANAKSVHIRFREDAGCVCLDVQDDGIGIPINQNTPTASLGLFGIRERVAVLGGSFSIEGMREGGTIAQVQIPLASPSPTSNGSVHAKDSHR